MVTKHGIVIVEDHTLLREGLKSLLSSNPHLEIVGEAENGQDAIRCIAKLKPTLVLMDLSMPKMNGMDALKAIKKLSPETKTIVLTVHKDEEYILAALDAGANGYIVKDSTSSELIIAINSILNGKRFISPSISEKVIDGYLEGRKSGKPSSSWSTLTQREREILKMIAEGYKSKDIAEYLCISLKTAEKHRSNLMKKLNLHSISALTAFAIEKGLVNK
ncbi:MAG TPA: response regulator transcription factor [Thermodesulfobacteriota bacterium]|nr:response regulator transcription factor [Thermodesulfobacteriota bacterium]